VEGLQQVKNHTHTHKWRQSSTVENRSAKLDTSLTKAVTHDIKNYRNKLKLLLKNTNNKQVI